VVFFTGPDYEDELLAEFPGATLIRIGGYQLRECARIEHQGLPVATRRTYHPGYMRRSRKWGMLEDIARAMRQAAVSTARP
jgi:hypothetical protein